MTAPFPVLSLRHLELEAGGDDGPAISLSLAGEAFPRISIDPELGILQGDGTAPPSPIVFTGGTAPVQSVNAKTGAVVVTAADVLAVPTASANLPNGYLKLDVNGKASNNQLPGIAITDTSVVASQAAMLALTAQKGDVAVRTDLSKTYILAVEPATVLGNWQEIVGLSGGAVQAVAGKTGSVTLDVADVANAVSALTVGQPLGITPLTSGGTIDPVFFPFDVPNALRTLADAGTTNTIDLSYERHIVNLTQPVCALTFANVAAGRTTLVKYVEPAGGNCRVTLSGSGYVVDGGGEIVVDPSPLGVSYVSYTCIDGVNVVANGLTFDQTTQHAIAAGFETFPRFPACFAGGSFGFTSGNGYLFFCRPRKSALLTNANVWVTTAGVGSTHGEIAIYTCAGNNPAGDLTKVATTGDFTTTAYTTTPGSGAGKETHALTAQYQSIASRWYGVYVSWVGTGAAPFIAGSRNAPGSTGFVLEVPRINGRVTGITGVAATSITAASLLANDQNPYVLFS